MKTIEKPNGQIFEVCTSRSEFARWIKNYVLYDAIGDDGVWIDEDSSLYLKFKSGKEIALSIGDKLVPINYSQIACGLWNNPGTQMIYKVPIVFNSHYEDWEAQA